jgi:hypothetical protein
MTGEQREAIRLRLAEIEAKNGGRLTPDAVVQDAKSKDSPLHGCFTWDVKKAAYAHWIEQARTLITSVQVVQRTEKTSVRTVFYVRDPSAKTGEQGYVSTETLRSDTDMAREAIVAEFSRVADMLRRARELAVVLNASEDVEKLIEGVVGLRQRFIAPPPAKKTVKAQAEAAMQ